MPRSKPAIRVYSSASDRAYLSFVWVFMTFAALVILIPLIFIVAASLSSPEALLSAKVFLWPVDLSLRGYRMILEHKLLVTGFKNSLFYAGVGTCVNVIVTILAAYPLSRKDLKIRSALMFLFTFTMLFSGGMIPTYLVVKNIGLINSRWALIIPGAMAVWNMIIMRTYFQASIPDEMLESANIDGCDDFRFLIKMVLPLSVPIIAVNVLLYAVGHWNSYFSALLYINDAEKYPLQMVMRDILIQDNDQGMNYDMAEYLEKQKLKYLLQYSTIVVGTLPVMLLYPFVQRYFIKGIMIGAIKG